MASYVVLSFENTPDRADEKTVFVRDAFSVLALAFPMIWLVWYRLWFHAAVVAVVTFGGAIILQQTSFWMAIMPLNLLLSLLVALEGPAWRINALQNKSYKYQGTVEVDNLENAQLIWAMAEHPQVESEKPIKNPFLLNARIEKPPHDMLLGNGGGH